MYRLTYNSAYNVLRREMPSEVGEVRYSTVALTNASGTTIRAAVEATIWGVKSKVAVVSLAAAVLEGDYTCTLTLGTETTSLYPGDLLRIGGGTGTYDTLEVESYDATTYTVTFKDYFKHDHASGATAVGRWVSYTLDTTTVATWTATTTGVIEWTFSLVAGSPLAATRTWTVTDEFAVDKRGYGAGDLENHYRARYRRYYDSIEPGDFVKFEEDARAEINDMFLARGKDVERLVDSKRFDELLMAQISLMVAASGGDDWQVERDAIQRRRDSLFDLAAALPLWVDENQDLIKDDEEIQAADRPIPRRRLF